MSDVTLLPRYPIPGYPDMDPREAAERLHQRKNRPEQPDIDFVPRESLTAEQREYPRAMYREWAEDDRERARVKGSRQLQLNIRDPFDLEQIDAYVGAYDSTNALNADHKVKLRLAGWGESHAEAKQIAFMRHRHVASDAAVSNTTDSRMTARARAERDAAEDAAPDHIAEIPHTPIPAHRKRGRAAKVKA